MPDTSVADPSVLRDSLAAIAARYPEATVGIAVRDAETGTTVDLNAARLFHAASTMKLPVLIEVYRRAHAGMLRLDDTVVLQNRFRSIVDGSVFQIEDDTGDALYGRLGEPVPVRTLVEQMIHVSSNLATNALIDYLTADSVQATIRRLGTQHMEVLRGVEDLKAYRQGLSNSATAADLALLLERLAVGTAVSPEADAAMLAVLEAEDTSAYVPPMIEAGLPAGTRVANKNGWLSAAHHDAAVVLPEGQPPYVLVVLTEGLEDKTRSAALGAEVAAAVHVALRER